MARTLLNKAAELYFSLFSISFKHSKDDKKDESELIEFNDSLDGSFAESDVSENTRYDSDDMINPSDISSESDF